jgi:uncharacterized RDD family membrane protein YckC
MSAAKPKSLKTKSGNRAYNPDRNVRTLVTPEGIDLRLRLADIGSRIGAFFIDLVIMVITLILFSVIVGFAASKMGRGGLEFGVIIWLLGFFILRNFYFMFFEMGPKGATPGKRWLKIRVAARNGGHLTAGAVFARNAMREIEFFLPLGFAFSRDEGVGGVMILLGLIWGMIFLLFPLFNKDHLRGGDLIAGTWVVNAPRLKLSKDLAAAPKTKARFIFTPAQVDAYGVKELHVLETVLRKTNKKTVSEVAERIMAKIEWPDPDKISIDNKTEIEFLNAYYAALRGKLETKLLFGVRRKDKFDKS